MKKSRPKRAKRVVRVGTRCLVQRLYLSRQAGQRGSQEAMRRAMARRIVMKESAKCRPGRAVERVIADEFVDAFAFERLVDERLVEEPVTEEAFF